MTNEALETEDDDEQAAQAGGMTDPEAPADTRDMYMVHTVFRREFAELPALVRGVVAEDTDRMTVVADHASLMLGMLEAHHRAEDIHLWPRLLERGGEEVAPVVHTMEGQHEQLEQLTAQIVTTLGQWREDTTTRNAEPLADVLDRLAEVLHGHMGLEEAGILPLAEKYVTAAEWHAMSATSGAGLPPGKMPLVFGMTLYEADPEVIENTLSGLPPEVRSTLEEQGARDFAAHAERVHGTPTPRRSAPLAPRN